jgi:hypothetical protein
MSTKTKNIILLALVSTTFVLSIVSYATQQQQQVLAQEEIITEEENEPGLANQSATEEEEENEPGLANQSATEEDQKIILDDITIPIKSNTQLSIEMPDSKITVEPIK